MDADPVWPVVALASFQALDAVACAIPLRFITVALDRVDCPPGLRRVLPWIKAASAAGLVAGLWVAPLGLLTVAALVTYFVIATGFHLRVHDAILPTLGPVGMLALCLAVGRSFL